MCPALHLLLTSSSIPFCWCFPSLGCWMEALEEGWLAADKEERGSYAQRGFHLNSRNRLCRWWSDWPEGRGESSISATSHLRHMHPRKKCLPGGATVNLFSLLSRCPWMSSLMEGGPFRRNDSVEVGSGGTLNKLCR